MRSAGNLHQPDLPMTDHEIIQLCLDPINREKGYRMLVSAYSKKLYWHIRRMVTDHDDANDVVQNVFIKVWKALPDFRADSKLFTWLYRIATNEAITFVHEKYRRSSVALESEHAAHLSSMRQDAWFDADDTQRLLQLAIDSLPDKQKQVFVMRYYDEMKYEEMEEILGTSQGALKASFHHAVKKVEEFLKRGLNQA